MTKKKKIIIAGVVVSAVLVSLLAFMLIGRNQTTKAKVNVKEKTKGPVQVTTALATVKEIPAYIDGTGSFVADETTDIAPKVSGQVISTFIEVGDFVRTGQVVAKLDDKDERLKLEQAKSAVRQAEISVKQAQARLGIDNSGKFNDANVPEVQQAYLNYEAAIQEAKLAAVNERRFANLLQTGDTSRLQYDQYRTTAETSAARAKALLKQYENSKNLARQNNQQIVSARAAVTNAQTQVDIANKAIADTVVYAPFSGSVDERPVSKGEYVTPSSKIATIVRTNPIKLSLPLPESQAGKIGIGMGVSASVAAYPDQNFAGSIAAIQPSLEVDSRSIIIEAEINNGEGKLRPGMFGTAQIVLSTSDSGVFVPITAVMTDETTLSSSVYVIKDGVARLTVVQIGDKEDDQIRIIMGIGENETVATSNLQDLYDGATVVQ